jgi:predicted lactoylglutathione lyase
MKGRYMAKQLFVNLPVKDLKRSVAFFSKLGFDFDQKFTDENATCMIIGENIFAMLLVEDFFKTFTSRPISDATKSIEVITTLALDSRAEVDQMLKKVVAAGGTESGEPKDHGWMYYRSFQDLDGHTWEVMYADESKMSQ